jgi:hypothetical protein
MSMLVDHLIYATSNLEAGIESLEELLGVSAIVGGSHPGLGTCNALMKLGPRCYLEIMAPDPVQSEFEGTRPYGIDNLDGGQLAGWVAHQEDLMQFVQAAKSKGIELGEVIEASRATPEGKLLTWDMTYFTNVSAEAMSVLPLFIDWGKTPHPAFRCHDGAQLANLTIQYPNVSEIVPITEALELDVCVCEDSRPGIRVLIDCPNGQVELGTPR